MLHDTHLAFTDGQHEDKSGTDRHDKDMKDEIQPKRTIFESKTTVLNGLLHSFQWHSHIFQQDS